MSTFSYGFFQAGPSPAGSHAETRKSSRGSRTGATGEAPEAERVAGGLAYSEAAACRQSAVPAPAGSSPSLSLPRFAFMIVTTFSTACTSLKGARSAEDLFAYLAAVLSHPGYTSAFAADLAVPGLRVPVTAEPEMFRHAVTIGRRVLWLHSYGQHFHDPADNRLKSPPRLPHDRAPKVLGGYPIPGDPEHMPDALGYDPGKHELSVGGGHIGNVTPRMREYDISGVNVLNKWFSYRRRNRERPPMGARRFSPLQEIQAKSWLAEYTSELIDLLHVLGLLVDLEPEQAQLLTAIVDGSLISVDDLTSAKLSFRDLGRRTSPGPGRTPR